MQNDIGVGRLDEEILTEEVSDDELERAAGGKWQPNASPTFYSLVLAVCCQF